MKNASLQIPASIREKVILAPYTSFNIGGPAKYFAEPVSTQDFIELLSFARKNRIKTYILGGGSNTLFEDKGFNGLVIHPQLKRVSVDENTINAESGALISQVLQIAMKHELSGMEGWVGLPGTVGGAVRGNAGASGIETKDLLVSATILDTKKNKIEEYTNAALKFGYRESLLKKNPHLIVLSATFLFPEKCDVKKQQLKMQETLKKRMTTQPKGKNAGCMFKNETGSSAGKLIDDCGLKGTRIGDIEISTIHGNFLQNLGHATQKDVIATIALIKKTVYSKKKIKLHEEVQIVKY